jgi:hypothetical protein
MKEYVIVKKGVVDNLFNPDIKISMLEYNSFVENSMILSWREDTPWGSKLLQEDPEIPVKVLAYLNFDFNNRDNCFVYIRPPHSRGSCGVVFDYGVTYMGLKAMFDIAREMGCNLWDESSNQMVTKADLEALRVKEENRGIKLTKEQSHVLTQVEEQCRWYHILSDDQEKIMHCFPVTPELREAEITEVIDDIQFENLVCMATIPGHTLLFGFHLPYINYADEADYKLCTDHTARLKEHLNRLSKAFGSAEFYEYREEDPDMMRMVLSKKGKFGYASLFAEGEFDEEFGTSKRSIPPDSKTYWKTVKKWGMAPSDLLTYVMKQKLPVKVFQQGMYWKWLSEEATQAD